MGKSLLERVIEGDLDLDFTKFRDAEGRFHDPRYDVPPGHFVLNLNDADDAALLFHLLDGVEPDDGARTVWVLNAARHAMAGLKGRNENDPAIMMLVNVFDGVFRTLDELVAQAKAKKDAEAKTDA